MEWRDLGYFEVKVKKDNWRKVRKGTCRQAQETQGRKKLFVVVEDDRSGTLKKKKRAGRKVYPRDREGGKG